MNKSKRNWYGIEGVEKTENGEREESETMERDFVTFGKKNRMD